MNESSEMISSEDVMAYVDGELPPARAAEVARAIATDAHLQKDMDDYVLSSAALKHAFDDVLLEPVPESLRRQVLGGMPADNVRVIGSRHRPTRIWQQALAACIILGVGLVIGVALQPSPDSVASSMIAGSVTSAHPLAETLDTARSGDRLMQGSEEIHIVQTFLAADGKACREYEVSRAGRGVTGIACREANAWQVAVLVSGASNASDGFAPASGPSAAAIDEVYLRLGASDGIDDELERCLIENNWMTERCTFESSGIQ